MDLQDNMDVVITTIDVPDDTNPITGTTVIVTPMAIATDQTGLVASSMIEAHMDANLE